MFPGGLAILAEMFDVLGIETDAHRGRRDARRPALRHGRPLHGRRRARAQRARDAGALSRRPGAGRARRGDGAGFPARRRRRRGSSTIRSRSWCCRGPRACTRSGSTSRTRSYHKHGAYLLENADMPGFPRKSSGLLARLVGAHRRKLQLEVVAGTDAAVGHQGAVPDRAAAAGGAAASGPQRRRRCRRSSCSRKARALELGFPRAGSTRIR